MKTAILFLLVSVAIAAAEKDEIEKINKMVDEVIERFKKDDSVDPIYRDFVVGFEKSMLGVTIKGECKLNATISGLSSVKRKGDVVVVRMGDDRIVRARMALDEVKAALKGSATFMSLGREVQASVDVESSEIDCILDMSKDGGEVSAMSISAKKIGDVLFEIKGLGMMAWAGSMIASRFQPIMKGMLKTVINGQMAKILMDMFKETTYKP